MGTTPQITAAQIDKALASGDKELLTLAQRYLAACEHPLNSWQPRPDQPDRFDCQTGFVADRSHKVCVCLGGTGSGKSDADSKHLLILAAKLFAARLAWFDPWGFYAYTEIERCRSLKTTTNQN